MALTNFTVDLGAAVPVVAATTSAPLRVDLDDLLYSPEEHQAEYAPRYAGNEPFDPPQGHPQARRPKVRKRAGPTYLPPPNQYTQYPRQEIPHNPFNSQLHTQVYQNTRLDITLGNQRVQEINSHYDNAGQYIHDPAGDYDYGQRNNKKGPPNTHNPGFAEAPYASATTPGPTSSRKFENPNQNFNNYNYVNNPITQPTPATPPSTKPVNPQTPPDRPRGFTKVEANSPGGKTQLHAILDYDDEYYEDDNESDSVGPPVTPLQGPIFVRNGSVPVVPLTSYPTVNNGSFYQIPILWTALSLALGYELQGQIIRGVPCVKRNFQLYCPTAGNTYPLDKIENFIDENKALIKRMYGSFTTPGGNRVRRAPGVPDLHTGDSFFRHVRQARQASKSLPDAQSVNNTGRDKIENFIDENKALIKRMYGSFTTPGGNRVRRAPGVPDLHTGDSFFRHVRQARQASKSLPDAQSVNNTGRIDSCESKTEIMTPYWALNSARKLRAIVNTMHFEQAIHQEVCSKESTARCSGDCGCEQKYKWHRLLAYDPSDDCAGIFMDWFLFPSCCVCRCKP